ncbi:DUF6126 family protein [Streptomyces sp. NPDC098789]|uniref:DUF6126 family protein n=1 Tax=Streptomyces sp. NPDC098789 TaxID=3366098 RepID=UPI0037FA7932
MSAEVAPEAPSVLSVPSVPSVPSDVSPVAGVAPVTGVAPVAEVAPAAESTVRMRIESKFPRGLIIRLTVYLFVGHLFAFFVYLLFVLGAENQ